MAHTDMLERWLKDPFQPEIKLAWEVLPTPSGVPHLVDPDPDSYQFAELLEKHPEYSVSLCGKTLVAKGGSSPATSASSASSSRRSGRRSSTHASWTVSCERHLSELRLPRGCGCGSGGTGPGRLGQGPLRCSSPPREGRRLGTARLLLLGGVERDVGSARAARRVRTVGT
jgi:hypothetical protein